MGRKFFDLAFTPSIKTQQEQHGARDAYLGGLSADLRASL